MKRLNYCYCDVCEKETDTYEKEIEDIFQVKDEKIQAKIKIRICKTCGNEVYDEKLGFPATISCISWASI